MRPAEPVRCVVCQDAGSLVATQGDQGAAQVLATFPAAGHMPARVLIACPHCASGNAAPINYLDYLDPYPHQEAAIATARALALSDAPAGWLVFAGGYGSGKSTIADATVRTLRSRGLHLRSYTAPELKAELYGSFRAGNHAEWLGSLKRARGLCIDELDAIDWSNPQVEETFSELLNARYSGAASSLTILAGADFRGVPGRIFSRMRQFGILDLGPIDLRQPADDARVWDRGEGEP